MYIENVSNVFANYSPLTNYISDLIDRGYNSLDNLKDDHKKELVALIMDSLNDDQSYVLFDTDEFNDNCNFFKNSLRTNSIIDLISFQQSLYQSALNKYRDQLVNIFYYFNSLRSAA